MDDEAAAKFAEVYRDVKAGKHVEANGVLVRRGDDWSFSIDFDNGASISFGDTYPTREAANAALNDWYAEFGITGIMQAN